MKKWVIGKPDAAVVAALHRQSDLSQLCCTVLAAGGCLDITQAGERIGSRALSDPFLLRDMQEAADRINAAIDDGTHICVYGDYDCDGITATVILYSFLSEIGANVSWRVPERAEGYGLNPDVIREMHDDGVGLIVTVDNGIAAIAEAELAAELGIDLVITDHHRPGKTLPRAVAVVDAHREENLSPFRQYCGAGIALLLVAALSDGDTEMALEQFGDLAAIATIADVVTLTGENRYIVEMGMQYLENTERPGLRALREISGLGEKPLTARSIAFSLSPRINATGRMASPRLAVELLLEENPRRAAELAEQINVLNARRMETEQGILAAVSESLRACPDRLYDRVLVLDGEGWDAGVIGITAARLSERFGKPCFMIGVKDGVGVGSARSFGEFSVFECLSACSDCLEKFGGHPAAGGFTVKAERIAQFRERVAAFAAAQHDVMPVRELRAVCALTPAMLDMEEIRSLSQLEPFGEGNPEPVFLLENAQITAIRSLSEGAHTKFTLLAGGQSYEALLFRTSPEATGLHVGDLCHMMVQLSINVFRGRESVNLLVQDFRTAGLNQSRMLAARQAYERLRRREALSPALYTSACPTREECITIYKRVPQAGIAIEQLALQLHSEGLNYCKLRVCLDIFAELGLMAITEPEGQVMLLPVTKKVNLQDSTILRNLEARQHGSTAARQPCC